MSAMGPDILTLGCPSLTMFSCGFSPSPSPALFLHRIRVRVVIQVEGLEARRRSERRHLPVEGDLGSQASDLVAIFGVDIGENGVGALSVC
jgi:hypothetical protein